MPLKDTMRRREGTKRWCLAERWDGELPEARIARRETLPLTHLTCCVSQSSLTPLRAVEEAEAASRSGSAEGGIDAPVHLEGEIPLL